MLHSSQNVVYSTPYAESILFEMSETQLGQLVNWLQFSFVLFFTGLLGMIFNQKNYLVTMMAIELMYLGVISSFVLFGTVTYDSRAAIYGLLFLILAACESAVGLGVLIVLYRFGNAIEFTAYEQLGG